MNEIIVILNTIRSKASSDAVVTFFQFKVCQVNLL